MARVCTIIGSATRIARIPETLYHYHLRKGSITASLNPKLTHDWLKAADDRDDYVTERFPELRKFMKIHQLTFLADLDYEAIRQSLITGLNIDPEDDEPFTLHEIDAERQP